MPTSRARRDRVLEIYRPLIGATVSRLRAFAPSHIEAKELHRTGELALMSVADHLENYIITRLRGSMLDSVKRLAPCISIEEIPPHSRCLAEAPVQVIEQIDAKRRSRKVIEEIRKLPVLERRVISAKLRGASEIQIARSLDVSVRSVNRANQAAVAQLRASLVA